LTRLVSVALRLTETYFAPPIGATSDRELGPIFLRPCHADITHVETPTPALAGSVAQDFKVAKLPIDRQSIKSRRLLDMIEMVEVLIAPGERAVWQMLVDAGADADHLAYRDPSDDTHSVFNAALQFSICWEKLRGFLIVEDDRLERCYRLFVQHEDHLGREVIQKRVRMSNFASSIFDLVDDGARRSENLAHGLIRD
jgi:hypothetical protein